MDAALSPRRPPPQKSGNCRGLYVEPRLLSSMYLSRQVLIVKTLKRKGSASAGSALNHQSQTQALRRALKACFPDPSFLVPLIPASLSQTLDPETQTLISKALTRCSPYTLNLNPLEPSHNHRERYTITKQTLAVMIVISVSYPYG